MRIFDELLEAAKAAALASVSELEGEDLSDPDFSLADSAFQAVDDLVPQSVDQKWCTQVVTERPELWNLDADGESIADALRNAVRDLIIDEIDADLKAHARSVGLDIGNDESPTP